MELLARYPVPDPDVAARVVGGEVVLLSSHDGAVRVLNELGSFVWQLIDGRVCGHDILDRVLAEYAVESARARADLETFLRSLEEARIIVLADRPASPL